MVEKIISRKLFRFILFGVLVMGLSALSFNWLRVVVVETRLGIPWVMRLVLVGCYVASVRSYTTHTLYLSYTYPPYSIPDLLIMESVYKNILKELRIITKQAHVIHEKSNLVKQKTKLEYEKLQRLKNNQSVDDITKQIDSLTITSLPSNKFELKFKQIFQQKLTETPDITGIQHEQFHNIYRFLSSQRVYQELLERYNPGINMDAQENITKSANRVGLKVPE